MSDKEERLLWRLRNGLAGMLALILLCCCSAAGAEEDTPARSRQPLANEDDRVHELTMESEESYILPSLSRWRPYSSGGEKHVLIVSSGEWYVESCPEWVEMYILEQDGDSYAGRATWALHPLEPANPEAEEKQSYPGDADVFLRVGENNTGEERRGVIYLRLADGTQGKITVLQARHVEELAVEIVKPCAEAVDSVMAGYETEIEIRMRNAKAGRVRISDLAGNELYTAEFAQEEYSFDYVFESGCYVITAEAAGAEWINSAGASYVSEQAVITVSELKVIEEIGVTENFVEYLKAREGKRNMPYLDSAGNWTIGYGHLISAEAAGEYADKGWTDEQCEEQLIEDLKLHADLMRQRLPEEIYEQLTPNQFDALVSMEFNACGRAVEEQYRLGQCLLNLEENEDWEVVNGFITWHGIHDGEIDVQGLYYRRMEEARIFLYGDYTVKYNWPIPWWLNIDSGGTGRSIHEVPSGNSWYEDVMPVLDTGSALIETDGGERTEYITISSSSAWSIHIGDEYPWLSASNYRGSDGAVVRLDIEANGGETRHGIITVRCGAATRNVHVHQTGGEE